MQVRPSFASNSIRPAVKRSEASAAPVQPQKEMLQPSLIVKSVRRLWNPADNNPDRNIYFAGRTKVIILYDYVKSLFSGK